MIFTNTENGTEYAVVMGDNSSPDIFLVIKDKLRIKLTEAEAYTLSFYIGYASIESSLRSEGLPPRKLYHEEESQPNPSDSAKQE